MRSYKSLLAVPEQNRALCNLSRLRKKQQGIGYGENDVIVTLFRDKLSC